MKQMKTKGYGSIRKLKAYGTVGVLALGTSFLLVNHQVLADEVTTDDTVQTELVSETTVDIINDTDSEVTADETNTSVETASDSVVETTEVADSTEVANTVDSSEVEEIEEVTAVDSQPVMLMAATATDTTTDISDQATSTATITLNDDYDSGFGTEGAFSITTELDSANVGDTVTYTYENLPNVGGLNGATLTDENDIVIGTISVKEKRTNAPQLGSDMEAQANMPLGMNTGTLTVTFTSAVNDLEKIKYTISSTNAYQTLVASPDEWTLNSTISSNGQILATDSTTIEAVTTTALSNSVGFSAVDSRDYDSADGNSDIKYLAVTVMSDDVDNAGTVYTISDLDGANIDTSKIKIGDTVTLTPKRVYSEITVNDYNAYVKPLVEVKATVKAISSNSISIELSEDLPSGFYQAELPVIYDTSKLEDGYQPVSLIGSSSKDDVSVKVRTGTVKNTGATTSATATQTGYLIVEHVTSDGTVLETEDAIKQAVGTSYSTSAKTYDDYNLVTTPDNASGAYVRGTTVVKYVYEHKKGSVVEHYYIEGTTTQLKADDTIVSNVDTGTDYQGNEPEDKIVLENGQTYQLVTIADNLSGQVIEGTTELINYYQEVLASVVVHYVDEDGNIIAEDVFDLEESSLGVDYDTTDNKPDYIEVDGVYYKLQEAQTIGEETGTLTEAGAEVTYVYHKIVTNWVDQDSNESLKDTADGEQEAGTIDGYDYVETVVDEETGDITHYFKQTPVEEVSEDFTTPDSPVEETTDVVEEVPVVQSSVLPETGEDTTLSLATVLFGILMTMVGFLGIRKRKED